MTTWSNQSKNSSSFSNASKNSSTFSNISKTLLNSFLLMETSDKLLMESGDGLILETAGTTVSWSNLTKN